MTSEQTPPKTHLIPEKPKPTLAAILAAMQIFDEAVAVDFDPAEVVGDLRDKVDAIKRVIDRLDFQAEWCRQQAEPFLKAAKALESNVGRLRDYVLYHMQEGLFTELPGNQYRAVLQNNPPSLELLGTGCSKLDFERYPNYVEHVDHFRWKNAEIRDALISKRNDLREECESNGLEAPNSRTFRSESLPFAQLRISQRLRFLPNPPEGAKKGKK